MDSLNHTDIQLLEMNIIKSLISGNNENGGRRNSEQGGNGPPNNRNNRDLLNLDVNDAPLFPARKNIVERRLAPQDYVGAPYGSAINLQRNVGNNGRNAGLNNNTKRGPLLLGRKTIQQTNIASHIQNLSQDNAPNFGAVPKRERQSYDRGGVNTEKHNSTRRREQNRVSNSRSLDKTQSDNRSNHYTGRVSSVDNIYRSRESLVGNNGRNSSTGRQRGRFQHGGNFGVGPFQQAPGNHQNYKRNHQRQGQGLGDRGCQYGDNGGNQESRGSTGGGAYKQILGYKRLEELTKQNPEEVITVLANQNSGFYDLLKSDTLRPDLVILLVKALAISCKAEFNKLKSSILASTFQEKFLDRLITLIGQLPTDNKRKHCFKYVIGDCLILCKAVMKLLPNNACDSFPRLFMTMNGALDGMKIYQKVNLEKESTHLKELQEQLIIAIEERQMRGFIASKATELLQHIPPPDNFRELSVFPTSKDIMSLEKPFVRPNIVEGAYTSVEHYLDVQFRLMREDFVKPLREGISEYLNMTNLRKKGHVSSVRIYHKVLFQETKAVKDKIGLMVCFDPDKKSKINWDYSKRFLFGSLLCFTEDNFQTVLFATVVDRNIKELKEGRIMIEFCEGTHSPNDHSKQEYLMVESEVYFEPYYHVLKALQKMDEDIFPMSEYIVEVQPESYRPKYFTNENVRYDLNGHIFPVLDERAWPRASQLKLDESQFQAFKSALTKEFVVIQGPPGTGKTHLGLKVARTLLRNSESWNKPKTPVLVVCFTNHALDQFLEGLIPVTKNLVRVGRQSKSEVLNQFSLRERKNESRRNGKIHALLLDKKNKQSELLVRIKSIQEDIEILTKHVGVVSLSTLKESGLDKEVLENFYKDNKLSSSLFLDWLKSGLDDYRNVDRKAYRMLDSLLPPYPVEEATDEENIYNSDMEQDEEVIFDSDIGLDIDSTSILPQVKLVVDFSEMREEAKRMKQEIDKLEDTFSNDAALYNRRWILEAKLAESNLLLEYFSAWLKDQLDVWTVQRLVNRKNLWNLTPHERWTLYKHWVSNLKQTFQEESTKLGEEFRTNARILDEAKLLDDLEVMKDATVIGMTTTGAARLQPLLQALKCKLVIVEEAAEVMESHIIVSLTKYCQHLILIADFTLARKYNFDISLFERMLKNGMHCEMLKVQHRMRPEIAKMIVPAIYPELFNHKSVLGFDNIMGISKSVFFVTHNHYEEKVCGYPVPTNKSVLGEVHPALAQG
uniref:(California timema) hypothetical protein n=1 Tax=Timema californicum TaxID=61474 RepID=A0A7R9PAA2_TIMCA|nr:unnamed protein product [Timema californicum]